MLAALMIRLAGTARALTLGFMVFAVLPVASPASGQTLTWGVGGAGGSGTWNSGTTANWFNGATIVWPGTGTAATFAGTSGTVTISGSVRATDLTFLTSGYTITGGTLALIKTAATPTISLASGLSGTIGSIVTGTQGFTLSGGGALALGGANTFTGTTTITSSTLTVAAANGLGATTSSIVNNGVLNLTAGAVTYGGLTGTMSGSGTANVRTFGGSSSVILNGNYSGYTGVWNIGGSGSTAKCR